MEDGNELPVIHLAKMSQVLNFNFFSMFKFDPERGIIDVIEQTENVFPPYTDSDAEHLHGLLSCLEDQSSSNI